MRARRLLGLIALGISVFTAQDVFATDGILASSSLVDRQPTVGLHVRPIGGYEFFNPGELNEYMSDLMGGMHFTGAGDIGIAADYVIFHQIELGIRMEYLFSQSGPAPAFGNSVNLQTSFGALPIYATLTFDQPISKHWKVGATGGIGLSPVYHVAYETNFSSDPTQYPMGTVNYGAVPFTAIGSVFVGYDVTPALGLRLEGSYRYLDAAVMHATEGRGEVVAGQALGEVIPIDVNASSFLTTLGVVVNL